MITYYLGLPGSGKTYRAVDHVYNCFLDKESKLFGSYHLFHTNINEFKFDQFNAVDKVAYNLDFDQLLISLTELRDLYLSKVGDSVLLERAAELKLTHTLFVIDEAHNFLEDKNDVVIWWLTYHRHLHQDIILITQSLDLIYRKYLRLGQFFFRAAPSSFRLRRNFFTYHEFPNYRLFSKQCTGTISVKFKQSVYDLYKSGANTQGKNVVYKYLIVAAVSLFLVVLAFMFLPSFLGNGGASDKNTPASVNSPSSLPVATVDHSASFTIVCVGFDCAYMGQTISLPELNGYEKKYALRNLETTVVSDGVMLRSYARNDNFLSEVINVSSDSSANN